jgi:protein-S-isoprenylcysteine O-methyltransferase Ste14
MSEKQSDVKNRNWYLRVVIQGLGSLLAMIALIFILAGRISYWQGWLFALIGVMGVSITAAVFSRRTDVVRERIRPGPGTKWWDKVFWALYLPVWFIIIIVACLDAGRFQWTRHLHFSIYILSYLAFAFSQFLHHWAMWVNKFYSSTVRIQMEREHEVVKDGPYRHIRHPGYIGGILMGISTSLALGSIWGLLPAAFMCIILIMRTYPEDTTLKKELSGYSEYAEKIKYRLMPGIW